MSGLVVLIQYRFGQEFYVDDDIHIARGSFVYDPGNGEWDAVFTGVIVDRARAEDDDVDYSDPFRQVVVNPTTGKQEEVEFTPAEEVGDWRFVPGDEAPVAYLPVFVETDDEDVALMAAAAASSSYVAFPSTWESEATWEAREYPGTLDSLEIDLPDVDAAYEIPDPGDCFCCAELEDYEVLTPAQMIERLQNNSGDFLLEEMISSEEERAEFWQQIKDWSIRNLDYVLEFNAIEEEDSFLLEAIEALEAGIEEISTQLEEILAYLKSVSDESTSIELKRLRREGKMLQRQFQNWFERLLDYFFEEQEVDETATEETASGSLSLLEAVQQLKEPILAALEKGYRYTDVAAMLRDKGIEITAGELKKHLSNY